MYNLLEDPELIIIADLAKSRLSSRYALRNCNVEKAFDSSISFVPTFNWKTPTHYIVCEVSDRPFPLTIKELFADISANGLSVKLMVIYPSDTKLSVKEFQQDIEKAKLFGIGLVSVDISTGNVVIQQEGLSVQLHQPKIDIKKFTPKLRPNIESVYTTYSNGDAKHAVQELGQIIETIIRNVAIQAKRKGNYSSGGDPSNEKYAFGNIVDDLVRENILDKAILGRCRGYVEDRNRVSHKPRNLKKAIELERKLKLDFQTGLRILEELPIKLVSKSYKLKL